MLLDIWSPEWTASSDQDIKDRVSQVGWSVVGPWNHRTAVKSNEAGCFDFIEKPCRWKRSSW